MTPGKNWEFTPMAKPVFLRFCVPPAQKRWWFGSKIFSAHLTPYLGSASEFVTVLAMLNRPRPGETK